MANLWFKFYGAEYLSDPKMDRLSAQERSCWLTMLCMGSQSNGIIKFLSIEGLLNKSGVHFDPYNTDEWDTMQNVLRNFEKYEMIRIYDDSSIEILNWDKRQETYLTNAERQAKYRDNKKSNEKVTDVVTKVTLEENRIEENRIDNTKNTYGEFKNVKLTEIEYNQLLENLKEKNTLLLIEELSTYMASKKAKYASHYATILSWARRRVTDHQSKLSAKTKTIA